MEYVYYRMTIICYQIMMIRNMIFPLTRWLQSFRAINVICVMERQAIFLHNYIILIVPLLFALIWLSSCQNRWDI